jgi:hypothetical protein
MMINQFLLATYRNAVGDRLFLQIHPPALGKHEIIVTSANFKEAKDKGPLQRIEAQTCMVYV